MNSKNISDEERKAIFEKGIFKTVLETNDRYSEHRPIVIAFVKEGTKYIYGLVCHKDDSGKIEPNYWVGAFEKSRTTVFEGQRWDLIDAYREYERAKGEHRDKREHYYRNTWSDLESKVREEHSKIMAQWEQENPEPKNPFQIKVSQ